MARKLQGTFLIRAPAKGDTCTPGALNRYFTLQAWGPGNHNLQVFPAAPLLATQWGKVRQWSAKEHVTNVKPVLLLVVAAAVTVAAAVRYAPQARRGAPGDLPELIELVPADSTLVAYRSEEH